MTVLEAQRIAISLMGTDDYAMADEVLRGLTRNDMARVLACCSAFGRAAWLGIIEVTDTFDDLQDALDHLLAQVEHHEGRHPFEE